MPKIKDIVEYLEAWAPPTFQEPYDNAGLITGDMSEEVTGVVIALDCIEAVVEDAIRKNCNLVVAHHPIIFKGIKKLTGKNYIEKTIIKAVRHDIAIFAIHTNLDHISTGVNNEIARRVGLQKCKILRPKKDTLAKLTTFVPNNDTDKVLAALHKAGAGMIGNYHSCSFRVSGTGTFLPMEEANPSIGSKGQLEEVHENRIEVIFRGHIKSKILKALFEAHPYEEVAYYLHDLQNTDNETGAGMIGHLPEALGIHDFFDRLKSVMNLKVIRHSKPTGNQVSKIAVGGGAGSFLLQDAIKQGADVFVSADFKYHEFFDANDQIVIADIGHYESEQFTKELIYNKLTENFANIALHFTDVNTNPIKYA
jgi:dinuclear metal center YbgI/SA1388 family protein